MDDIAPDNDDAVLAALGLRLDGPGNGDVQAACARIARRIHEQHLRVVGFVPAGAEVAVPPVLVHLGLALCDLTGATVAVVDANIRYPGLGAIADDRPASDDSSVFATRWLRGSLALMSPAHGGPLRHEGRIAAAGDVLPQLLRALAHGADLFAHSLVDLTGFELLGEHAAAAASMDAVVIVGRARHTREEQLIELAQVLPRGRMLGVLLVG